MTVFIDVSKVFDCVRHEILLSKLTLSGIIETFDNILASYLFWRSHKICCDSVTRRHGSMKHGLPQGLYVNNILNLPLKAYMQLYTDEILLIYTARHVIILYDYATSNLAKIYVNLPSFNIIKSKYNST